MQDDSGLKKALTLPSIYSIFQKLVRRRRAHRWLMDDVLRLDGHEKIVDVGCGPGYLLDELPEDITYCGFDISPEYIAAAQERFRDRGTFLVGTARDFLDRPDERMADADLVFCDGVLHHVDDPETLEILTLAHRTLRPGGRLVCIEPTYLAFQPRASRWIMSQDRGGNIRTEAHWKQLLGEVFETFTTTVILGRVRIPYVHIVLEGTKPG